MSPSLTQAGTQEDAGLPAAVPGLTPGCNFKAGKKGHIFALRLSFNPPTGQPRSAKALQSRCMVGGSVIPPSPRRCWCSARQPRCFSQMPGPPASLRLQHSGRPYPDSIPFPWAQDSANTFPVGLQKRHREGFCSTGTGEGASRRGKETSGLLGQDGPAGWHQMHPRKPASLAEVIAKMKEIAQNWQY